MKSARGARFTRGGGPGEWHRPRLSAEMEEKFSVRDFGGSICEPADIFARSQVRAWEERLTQATPRESIGCPELALERSRAGAVRFFGSLLEC